MSAPHWTLVRIGIEEVREGDEIALPKPYEPGHATFPVEQVTDCAAIEKVVLASGANRFHFDYGQDVIVIRPAKKGNGKR